MRDFIRAFQGWGVLASLSFTISLQAQTSFQFVRSFGFPALSTGSSPISKVIQGTDGAIYGLTPQGGSNSVGVVFKMQTDGSGYQVLHSFTGSTNDGGGPQGELLQGTDGILYGTTFSGGTNGFGTVFKINTDGSGFALLHSFSEADGIEPEGGLLEGREDGVLYGTTSEGGATNSWAGTVYRVNRDGSGFQALYNFTTTSGADPDTGMVEGQDGALYGTTITEGGYYSNGSIFRINRDGSGIHVVYSFLGNYGDGGWAQGRLVQGSDGFLYGTTKDGGNPSQGIYSYIGNGTIYKINTNNSGYQIIYAFPTVPTNGANPEAGLWFGPGGYLYGTTQGGGSASSGTVFKIDTGGASLTVLYNLTSTNGTLPEAALISGTDGALYGVTTSGGNGSGTAFKALTDGSSLSVIHDFVPANGGDGTQPEATVRIYGNMAYGTTASGGATGPGIVFSMNINGSSYSILHGFTNANGDGGNPRAPVIQGIDGALYGTTYDGGTNNEGTIFRVTTNGITYSVLHQFGAGTSDGQNPYDALVQGSDGTLYGTTAEDGSNYSGTVFSIKPDGSGYQLLHPFTNYDSPQGALIIGQDGLLYGTTHNGGTNNEGSVFSMTTNGLTFNLVYSFGAPNDGMQPGSDLFQAANGMLYGTTESGGSNYAGTIFQVKTNGTMEAVLHSFNSTIDGEEPQSPLIEVNGMLYGLSQDGGPTYDGTAYAIGLGGGGFNVLHAFSSSSDGSYPYGGLTLAPDGSLYGTLSSGGAEGYGGIFKLFAVREMLAAGSYGPGGFVINFTGGQPDQTYQVLMSTNLINWKIVGTPESDSTGSFQYTDPEASGSASGYYKTVGP